MTKKKTPAATDAVPLISAVSPGPERTVHVHWHDDRSDVINIAPVLRTFARRSRVNISDDAFSTVTVGPEGDYLVWSDGSLLSAGYVYEMWMGQMSNAEFVAATTSLHSTIKYMANRLGLSKRTISGFGKDRPIPRHVALAMRYLLLRAGLPRK